MNSANKCLTILNISTNSTLFKFEGSYKVLLKNQIKSFCLIINYNKYLSFMDNSLQLISWFAFGVGIAMMVKYHDNYTTAKKKVKAFKKLSLVRYSDIDLSGQKEKFVFIKDKCKKPDFGEFKIPIGSNQVLFNEFPMQSYRDSIYTHIYQNPSYYRSQHQFMLEGLQKLFPLPKVINKNLINIQSSYESIFEGQQRPGILSSILKYFLACLAAIPQALHQFFTQPSASRAPLISGPQWGTLTMISSLVTDTAFVVCYRIVDSKIYMQMIGSNKEDLINHVEMEQFHNLIKLCAVGGLLIGFNWKRIKGLGAAISNLCSIIYQQNFSNQRRRDLYNPVVGEDQNCIVCYAQCRNIIFKRCRHMIVCSRCAKDPDNAMEFCPMCRVPNDSGVIKVVTEK